ncbi:MAG: glycerol-3-phosphate dehydrogenase [Alphaproteobacteria bacterium]|nr:glycerol-3-phosphate dehydrogenase [Alphaproteobacteria bacterium]
MTLPSAPDKQQKPSPVDLFIIGGGVNGCGIARDAAGRGLSVHLAEMADLGGATSSASTKLFHGGLRYLEYFEIRLVREALIERETLLRAMPHISWPMRFILPYHKDMRFEGETSVSKLLKYIMPWMEGRRPAWLIRLGLFLYDHLGGRKILPATSTVDLSTDLVGRPLQDKYKKAYEYSDCWVQDSRLVVLNARDAAKHGAIITTHTKVISATRVGKLWHIELKRDGQDKLQAIIAKALVNASGPWIADVIKNVAHIDTHEGVRLVRGSHIVTKKLFDHNKPYFFQGSDGRIVFAIPYEDDFTLIGTTDHDYDGALGQASCTDEEAEYLCDFVSNYFKQPLSTKDIIWSYSGVRPLYADGAKSATAATRDYVLSLNLGEADGAPLLNIFGGKITTYRRLAESALGKLSPFFPHMSEKWTAGIALPGGDFLVEQVSDLIADLQNKYNFIDKKWATRLIRTYGTEAQQILGKAINTAQLGVDFGASLTEAEVVWLIENEYVHNAQDILWRRTKLGLRLDEAQQKTLQNWIEKRPKNQTNSVAANFSGRA